MAGGLGTMGGGLHFEVNGSGAPISFVAGGLSEGSQFVVDVFQVRGGFLAVEQATVLEDQEQLRQGFGFTPVVGDVQDGDPGLLVDAAE